MHPSFGDPCQHARVQPVFLGFHPLAEGVFVIIGKDRDGRLSENGTGIHALIDQVHRATGESCVGGENVPMRVSTGKIWKQGRVNVDNTVFPFSEKNRGQKAHVA